jgi:L-threonylcarbamoyladenylate synthase
VLPTILRLGGLPVEEIEKVIGKVRIKRKIPKRPHSPGQLAKHYSPKTPLKIIKDKEFKIPKKKRIGYLAFSKPPDSRISYDMIEILSKKGDLREAAANLFSALYRLDKAGLDIILAECIPEVGLGRAIMDRLYKASS